MLALIAAYAHHRVIGKDGRIPWDIPEEKHRFRDLTMGHPIIMGRRTYEEIGRPLPGRETIVVSRTKCFDAPHCVTVPSLGEALRQAAGQDAFVCGGAQLYAEALPLADVLYLTEIHGDFAGDAFFPAWRAADFEETAREDVPGEVPYTCYTLRRRALSPAQAQEAMRARMAQKGIVPGLEPMRALLERLGNPQNRCPAVHIAGTNGKGSTAACTAAILQAAGYRVGLYCTPAVFSPYECWRVDGTEIAPEVYARGITKLLACCDAMGAAGEPEPTAFEIETALAFWYFAEQACDIMVIECGMGGRDDATNVLSTTAVSVITSVGMDHMKFLGGTLAEIARAKGGIVKPGVPVVLQGQPPEVLREIRAICAEQNSPLYVTRRSDIRMIHMDAQSVTFDYRDIRNVTVSLAGDMQAENAAAAIEAVRSLRRFHMTKKQIRAGLRQVQLPGRVEQLCDAPVLLIDGAHNPNAASRLRAEVLRRYPAGGLVLIAGVLADKDFTEVGRLLAPLAKQIITVTPDNPRALAAEKLADCWREFCPQITTADSPAQAWQMAKTDGAPVLAFGSFSWLAALRAAVEDEI